MAETDSPSDLDRRSAEEARRLAERAHDSQSALAALGQEQVDGIVAAMAETAADHAEALAAAAVAETGFGVRADKVRKNLFAARTVHEFIRPMKTVGVLRRLADRGVVEIAEPFGVVAAVVPSTNPTSTAIYKLLIAMKARCAIVISPHPAAADCIGRTVGLLERAARAAGAPAGAISCLRPVALAGTRELMRHRRVALILATGGLGLVRAAYSAGKPAYGVGPGNAPAYVERSADVAKAVRDVLTGKTFDNGLLCSSENSVVVDAAAAGPVRRELEAQGGHFLGRGDADALARVLITPQRLPHPDLVGRSAVEIAERAGLRAPEGTRALVVPLDGVGREHPLSVEKLCPVLSYYVVEDWREGCERCRQILRYGGLGHTMAIHSRDEKVILEFALRKPAFRIVVNTPATLGAIGMTTGLDPSMTLGCGGHGGNVTSDNISPRHLLNVKRLAYETRTAPRGAADLAARGAADPRGSVERPGPPAAGLDAGLLAGRVAALLDEPRGTGARAAPSSGSRTPPPAPGAEPPVPFVCEADVRAALRESRPIVIDGRTIVTPAARDLANAHGVLQKRRESAPQD